MLETVELKTVGAQTDENEDACARPVTMASLRLSTQKPDEQAAWGTLTPPTGATAAERRVFDGAGSDPPESGSSVSEREIRAGRQCIHITWTAHWRLSASALL